MVGTMEHSRENQMVAQWGSPKAAWKDRLTVARMEHEKESHSAGNWAKPRETMSVHQMDSCLVESWVGLTAALMAE